MSLNFIPEPLRSAIAKTISLCGGTVTQEGNTIQITGKYELMRSLIALGPTLRQEAEKSGLIIELIDSDADFSTAAILGNSTTPTAQSGPSRS
jgi:hypothetical protein